jgi:hypothetical protein
MSDIKTEIKIAKGKMASKMRRMFSENPEVSKDGFATLKDAFGYHLPSFRMEEMENPEIGLDKCTLLAAKRDAWKELIDYLEDLQHNSDL